MQHVFPFVILWIGALMVVPARAQQTDAEQPVEEVFQAELVYPQEHGALQLSLAPWFTSITNQQTGQTSFTVEYGLTDAWQVEVEGHGFGYGAARASETLEVGTLFYATPGVVGDLSGNWQIGLGVPIGLADGADRFRLVGLLTYEIEFFNDD